MLRQLVLRSMWHFPVRIKVRIPSSDLLSTAERSLNSLVSLTILRAPPRDFVSEVPLGQCPRLDMLLEAVPQHTS